MSPKWELNIYLALDMSEFEWGIIAEKKLVLFFFNVKELKQK